MSEHFKAGDIIEYTRGGQTKVCKVWSPNSAGILLMVVNHDDSGYGPKEFVTAQEARRLNAYHVGDEVLVGKLANRFTVDNVVWDAYERRCRYYLAREGFEILVDATERTMRPASPEPERKVMPAVEVGQKWNRTSRQGVPYHLIILGVDEESHNVWVKPSWGDRKPFTTQIADLSEYSLADNFFEKVGGLPKTGYLLAAVEGDDDAGWAVFVEGQLFDTVEAAEDDLAGYGEYGADLRIVKATFETVE